MRSKAKVLVPLRAAVAVLFIFLAFSYRVSYAQSNPAPPARTGSLTLKDAVRRASKQNPQVVIAGLLVTDSDLQRQISRGALVREANLTAAGVLNHYNFGTI